MTWNFDDLGSFEFSVLGYAARLNGKYEMHGVLKYIIHSSRGLRKFTLNHVLAAFGEEDTIFDLRTENGRDYFIAATDDAAYVVLGNSNLYNSDCCGDIPIMKIDGIDSERDVITLSEVNNGKSARVIKKLCDLIKKHTREFHSMHRSIELQIKKEDTTPSMPWP